MNEFIVEGSLLFHWPSRSSKSLFTLFPFDKILGRFLLGFSAVEIVNRQFVVCFIPMCLIVAESARLVQFQVSGQFLGLLIGSLAGSFVKTSSEFNLTFPSIVTQNSVTRTSQNMEEDTASGSGRKLFKNETIYVFPTSGISHRGGPTIGKQLEPKLSGGIMDSDMHALPYNSTQLSVDFTKAPGIAKLLES